MDQMMGGHAAGFPLETWFWEMPLCTRWWTTATVLTSALVQCQIVTPFQLFYSFRAVFYKNQVCSPFFCPSQHRHLSLLTNAVLAPPHHIPLLRTPLPRPRLPRLLPHAVFPTIRRELRALTRAFLLAPPLRNDMSDLPLPARQHAVPRTPAVQHTRLHLVAAEPRHSAFLPWAPCLHGPVSAVGVDGVQPCGSRHCAQG